jgi:transposase
MSLVVNNPEFNELTTHNVKVKKMKKMKSIMKLVGKLARIFVGISRRNESYCPEKLQPLVPLVAKVYKIRIETDLRRYSAPDSPTFMRV